jgi:hypothetical protein
MSTDRDVTRIVRSWLDEGVTALPDRVLDLVLDQIPATPQRRASWLARRFPVMTNYVRFVAAAAAIILFAVLAVKVIPGLGVGGPSATPTPEPTPSASQRAATPTGPVTPGNTQATAVFSTPFTWYASNSGWLFDGETANSVDIHAEQGGFRGLTLYTDVRLYKDPCDDSKGLVIPAAATPQDLATAIASLPGAEVSAVTAVAVDGHAGSQVDFSVPPSAPGCASSGKVRIMEVGPSIVDEFNTGLHLRYSIITVNGTLVLLESWTTASAAGLDGDFAEIRQIIDSIRFE